MGDLTRLKQNGFLPRTNRDFLYLVPVRATGRIAEIAQSQHTKTFEEVSRVVDEAISELWTLGQQISTRLEDLSRQRRRTTVQQTNASRNVEHEIRSGVYYDLGCVQHIIHAAISTQTSVFRIVSRELEAFKDEQRLVSLGKTSERNMDRFETWFSAFAGLCFRMEMNLLPTFWEHIERQNLSTAFASFHLDAQKKINDINWQMIKACLVIEKQPQQVIRIGRKFAAPGVRLSVLPFWYWNVEIESAKAVLINRKTAEKVTTIGYNHEECIPERSAKLEKGLKSIVEFPAPFVLPIVFTRQRVEYSQLAIVPEGENEGIVLQTNEKYWIYFRVKIESRGSTLTLWTLSLPIWLIRDDPTQEVKAWSEALWYNSFPMESRYGLDVPRTILWNFLIAAIDQLFVGLGRKLSSEQRDYLQRRLFRGSQLDIVTYTQFILPNPLDEKPTSFALWLCHCWTILRWEPRNDGTNAKPAKPMKEHWASGKILGFMSQTEVQDKLKGKAEGTFIIRFPESLPGNIGVSIYNPLAAGQVKVATIKFSIKELHSEPLEDFILRYSKLTYLYSNYPGELNNKQIVDKKKAFAGMEEQKQVQTPAPKATLQFKKWWQP